MKCMAVRMTYQMESGACQQLKNELQKLIKHPRPYRGYTPEEAHLRGSSCEDEAPMGVGISEVLSDVPAIQQVLRQCNPMLAMRSAGKFDICYEVISQTYWPIPVRLLVTSDWIPGAGKLYMHMTFRQFEQACGAFDMLCVSAMEPFIR